MTDATPRPPFLRHTEERGSLAVALIVVAIGSLLAAGGLALLLRIGSCS